MCTVTYIPLDRGRFFLTSNRDEKIHRPTSPPDFKIIGNKSVWFPKDLQAGGTWIAASESGRCCCLLNGGFEKHVSHGNYGKSRGLIVLEAFQHENIHDFFDYVHLEETEPFTLIVVEQRNGSEIELFQFVWDGMLRHLERLDASVPKLWASSTLYSDAIRRNRIELFRTWLSGKPLLTQSSIIEFHGCGSSISIERGNMFIQKGELQTVSITQVFQGPSFVNMKYIDLLKPATEKNLLISDEVSGIW